MVLSFCAKCGTEQSSATEATFDANVSVNRVGRAGCVGRVGSAGPAWLRMRPEGGIRLRVGLNAEVLVIRRGLHGRCPEIQVERTPGR